MKRYLSRFLLLLVFGLTSLLANASSGYQLPFEVGNSVYVTVGNNDYPHSTVAKEHFAWDFRATNRSLVSIVASKPGKVVYLKTDGIEVNVPSGSDCVSYKAAYANSANYVVLEHSDGNQSVYLHLAENSVKVQLGQQVSQGEVLGTIGNTGWSCGTHLHFQVQNKGASWFETSISVTFDDVQSDGGVPQPAKSYISANEFTLVPTSIIDGAGSLVDPGNGGNCSNSPYNNYGCSRDLVRLHPHTSSSSTALFQVLRTSGQCDYVRLSGLQEAYVTVKGWNEQYPGESISSNSTIYKASALPVDIPLTPLSRNEWNLVAVTTTVPVPAGQTRTVQLDCASGSPSSAGIVDLTSPPAQLNPSPQFTPISGNVYWGGNGSLISFSNNQANYDAQTGFGRNKDFAKTLTSKNTLSMFQAFIQKSMGCSGVVIGRNPNSATGYSPSFATVAWKLWNQPDWSPDVYVPLPYTVPIFVEGYVVIKVSGALGGSQLKADCTP